MTDSDGLAPGLVAALARAQMAFPAITKLHTAQAGTYSYSYADLADVLAAVRPALNAEGIALVQTTDITEHGVELVTSLLYGDERLSSRWPLPIENAAPQQVGSVLTYMRRYAICALVGVAAEQDDDGAGAKDVRQTRPTTGKGTPPSDKSAQYLAKLRGELFTAESDDSWRLFVGCVLGGEIPDHPSGVQTSKLIDALLAAKKGTWPDKFVAAPSGAHVDDGTEPF